MRLSIESHGWCGQKRHGVLRVHCICSCNQHVPDGTDSSARINGVGGDRIMEVRGDRSLEVVCRLRADHGIG